MEISAENLALIIVLLFMVLLIVGIIYAIVSKNKGGGSPINSVTFFGATSSFQPVEQKAAIEHMLQEQSGKKMKEEESGDPEEK